MVNKETAYKTISELVDRFTDQYESYKKSEYNETLTRRDFIDPFFKALGWDIDNENGYAESYREVIHEDRIKIGKATKAPDYSFRLAGGKRLFFVEAKKPNPADKASTARIKYLTFKDYLIEFDFIWETKTLREFIIKGFVLDDERLKQGKRFGKDYFDELLERIREIRASERRFYLKITDIYEQCSIDYNSDHQYTLTIRI